MALWHVQINYVTQQNPFFAVLNIAGVRYWNTELVLQMFSTSSEKLSGGWAYIETIFIILRK